MMRKLLIAASALALIATAAYAIQPGTTGTNKASQQQGFRTGVLIQKNNTATATAGAATLNAAGSGIITTEALATAAGSPYTLTLTNNMVAAADLVFANVQYGTSTVGQPYIKTITPGAGSVVIVVGNSTETSSSVFNGTLKIGFFVLKQSANGAD
jgi:hypothetical protein